MSSGPSPPRRRAFQFGLGALLLAVIGFNVLAAALAGLLGFGDDEMPRIVYVAVAVAAPMAVMIAVSAIYGAVVAWRRLARRRRRQ